MNRLILSPRQMAWLLASIAAIMPFAIDAYLPAVPSMATYFNTSTAYIQTSLSTFLFGQAIGLLVGGSISDIIGRKKIVISGLVIFILSSLSITFTLSADQFMLLRFIQAIGAGMIAAMGAAIVRDFYEGQQAAQMFALIGLIMMLAPLLAPSIGSLLLHFFNWQAVFAFLAIYAFVTLILHILFLPQQNKAIKQNLKTKHLFSDIIQRYISVFRTTPALGFMFLQSFSFASMFCFLTESPYVYMQFFKLSEYQYALLFALNLIAMMSFNRITAWQLKKGTASHHILTFGIIIQFIINLSLFTFSYYNELPTLMIYAILVTISVGTQGFISANTQACFMQFFKEQGGSANGVMLSCQALISASIGYCVTLLHNATAWLMPMMMLTCTITGSLLLWFFSRHIWQNK